MKIGKETFTIEHVKLKVGNHDFSYSLDKSFFDYFGYSDLIDCNFTTNVNLNKSDNMMVVDISSNGWMSFDCDRCLIMMKYPINSFIKVIYYLNSDHDSTVETDKLDLDLVYLRPSDFSIDIGTYIYESFLTAIPMIRNCDNLIDKPCDTDMLDRINGTKNEAENNENIEIDPRWLQLKNLLNKKED